MPTCPNCGGHVKKADDTCKACGAPLPRGPSTEPAVGSGTPETRQNEQKPSGVQPAQDKKAAPSKKAPAGKPATPGKPAAAGFFPTPKTKPGAEQPAAPEKTTKTKPNPGTGPLVLPPEKIDYTPYIAPPQPQISKKRGGQAKKQNKPAKNTGQTRRGKKAPGSANRQPPKKSQGPAEGENPGAAFPCPEPFSKAGRRPAPDTSHTSKTKSKAKPRRGIKLLVFGLVAAVAFIVVLGVVSAASSAKARETQVQITQTFTGYAPVSDAPQYPAAGGYAIPALPNSGAVAALLAGELVSKPQVPYSYGATAQNTVVLPGASLFPAKGGGENYIQYLFSTADASAFSYAVHDAENSQRALYFVQNGRETRVCEAASRNYLAPLSGNLYYIDETARPYALRVFSGGKNVLLAESASDFAVSPGEQFFLFSSGDTLYRSQPGGETEAVASGESILPLAVSNDGETMFYRARISGEGYGAYHYVCLTSTGAQSLDVRSDDTTFYQPYSGSQLLINTNKGLYLLASSGIRQVTQGETAVLNYRLPQTTSFHYTKPFLCTSENFDLLLFLEPTPEEDTWPRTGAISLWQPSGLQHTIENVSYSSISNPGIYASSNNLSLLYLDKDKNAYLCHADANLLITLTKLAGNTEDIAASADFSHIYYANRSDGALSGFYHIAGDAPPKLIAPYVHSDFIISADGTACAYETTHQENGVPVQETFLYQNAASASLFTPSTTSYTAYLYVFNSGGLLYETHSRDGDEYFTTYYFHNGEENILLP